MGSAWAALSLLWMTPELAPDLCPCFQWIQQWKETRKAHLLALLPRSLKQVCSDPHDTSLTDLGDAARPLHLGVVPLCRTLVPLLP